MEKYNCKVIVLGPDGYNAMGLLRELTPFVSDVLFLCTKKSILDKSASISNYCTKIQFVKDYNEALVYLLRETDTKHCLPVLIATGDLEAEFIDNNKDVLKERYVTGGVSCVLAFRDVIDKNLMSSQAERCGFIVPKSAKMKKDSLIENITYPCIIKPDKHKMGIKNPFKTVVCHSDEELGKLLSSVSQDNSFILQEYVEKDYDILVYGCRLLSGEIIIAGANYRDRWDRGGNGSHGWITDELPTSISIDAIHSYLSEINYYGLFSVEFGLKGDKAYFFEFNLRNDGTSHYFYQAGVNLPLLWVLDSCGIDISLLQKSISGKHHFMAIIDDRWNVKTGAVSKSQWKKEKMQATVFRYYDKNDRLPFLYRRMVEIIYCAYHALGLKGVKRILSKNDGKH